jgi:hypothetical protein
MIQVELCRVLSAPHPTASAEGDPPVIHLLYLPLHRLHTQERTEGWPNHKR